VKTQLSVIAPCYNEVKNVRELVRRVLGTFAKGGLEGEIVLVDDGSADGTGDLLRELAQTHPEVQPVFHEKNKGIAAAWATGLEASKGYYACLIDSDLQYVPEDILRLYREILYTHADVIQGIRSEIGLRPDLRYYYSRFLNFLLNVSFGMRARDNKSGFVLCRRDVLKEILEHHYRYRYFQSFITAAAVAKGFSVREVETLFQPRKRGVSFINRFPLKVISGVLIDLVKGIFEYRLRKPFTSPETTFLRENHPVHEAENTLPGWRRWWWKLFLALMPLHHWMITSRAGKFYDVLQRTQWLSPEQIRQLQEQKLQRLIHHAYHRVAYYRDLFDKSGLKPTDIESIEDLRKIPLLAKDDVRSNLYFSLLSDSYDKSRVLKVSTSGSTGEPFVCYADQRQLEQRWAATQRSLEWTGYRFGDRQIRLWHQTLGMKFSQVMRERIDAFFNRRIFIPAYQMSEANIAKTLKKIDEYRPALLDGYAESFNLLALYTKVIPILKARPKGIISSAQVLPPQSRQAIEQAFHCSVFDKYGSREFSGIAYECSSHQGHHLVAENYIVEILKDGSPALPGETGEIVITDLNNYCMPMIRYRIGDLAVAMDSTQKCSCGRGLPLIGSIEGRVQAIVVNSEGVYLPGTFFAHFFKDHDQVVRQYQIVQEEDGRIGLKIVKAENFDQDEFEKMILDLRVHLGQTTTLNTEFVDHIPMVRTGKQQGSISRLKIDFQKPGTKTASRG
jgi:phenylacetate-CoA ligase